MSRVPARAGRLPALFAFALAAVAASGCVSYHVHIQVTPDGKVDVAERAEAMPGIMDSLHVEPRLAWSAFQATVEGRGGHFKKDRPDSLLGGTGTYELDSWAELGQRGQAFKSIDEGERRLRPANVQSEIKDQYFYKDTDLSYKVVLSEPDGATVDSLALPYAERATGTLELTVPGSIIKTNATQRNGNTLTYALGFGQTLDVQVAFREWQWVSMVSVLLVAIFLGSLALQGFKRFGQKGKKRPA
ncbi:MAG: hypothetical protein ABI960_09645 [Candidatus Eisenbacteria bacterium]